MKHKIVSNVLVSDSYLVSQSRSFSVQCTYTFSSNNNNNNNFKDSTTEFKSWCNRIKFNVMLQQRIVFLSSSINSNSKFNTIIMITHTHTHRLTHTHMRWDNKINWTKRTHDKGSSNSTTTKTKLKNQTFISLKSNIKKQWNKVK